MNIELVGMPGVGKSYVCRSVEAVLLQEKARLKNTSLPLTSSRLISPNTTWWSDSVKKVARAFAFICSHPLTAFRLLRLILGNGQGFQRNRTTKYVNLLSEMQRLHPAHAQSSLLTDQGVLQAIWSLEMLASSTIYQGIMQLTKPWLPDVIILILAESSQHEKTTGITKNGSKCF